MGTSLAIQCLGLGTFTAVDPGSIPGQGTKILLRHCSTASKKKRKILMPRGPSVLNPHSGC